MPEYISVPLSIVLGILGTLLVTSIRHRLKMSERYRELLATNRLSTCDELRGMLIEFYQELSDNSFNATALVAAENRNRLNDLARFVALHEMVLGIAIARCWYKHHKALWHIQLRVQHSGGDKTFPAPVLRTVLQQTVDKIGEIIRKQLQGIDVKFVSFDELERLSKEGRELVDVLLKKYKEAGRMTD